MKKHFSLSKELICSFKTGLVTSTHVIHTQKFYTFLSTSGSSSKNHCGGLWGSKGEGSGCSGGAQGYSGNGQRDTCQCCTYISAYEGAHRAGRSAHRGEI